MNGKNLKEKNLDTREVLLLDVVLVGFFLF